MQKKRKKVKRFNKASKNKEMGNFTLRCEKHPNYSGKYVTRHRLCATCRTLHYIETHQIGVNVTLKEDISEFLEYLKKLRARYEDTQTDVVLDSE